MELEIQHCITYIFSHYFAKIKVGSCDSLPIKKDRFCIIHIKSVINKDKNYYYCTIFFKKWPYQLVKK